MIQNDWTSQMRRRLADREAPVPNDLWDKIEARIDGPRNRRYTVARVAVWAASAAAAVLLLVVAGYNANKATIGRLAKSGGGGLLQQPAAGTESRGSETEDILGGYGKDATASCALVRSNDIVAMAATKANIADSVVMPDKAAMPATTTAAGNTPRSKKEDAAAPKVMGGNNNTAAYASAQASTWHKTGSSVPRFSIGLHTGGAIVDSRADRFPMQKALMSSSTLMGDGSTGITYATPNNVALMSRYNEVSHHSQPVSFGLSVGYAVSSRLSITSGVVYTRAVSDFTKSSGTDEVVETQKLHYIGVPLGVRYRVWGNSLIQAYAIAGGEADFNVAAKTESAGVTRHTAKDRVQMSASAAAGIQLNIVPQVGVYAEPGVRYYFDNKSAVATIFKDQPWAFNMQVGVRVDF